MRGGEGQRERARESDNSKQAPCSVQYGAGCGASSHHHEIMT